MKNQKYWDSFCWYAVYTLPKQEDRAESNLRAWGVETFYPKSKVRKFNDWIMQFEYKTKALFPRYIFARFQMNNLYHKVRFTRGVHSLVSFGDSPTPLPDEIISVIRSRMDEDGMVVLGERILPGDDVLIKGGVLKGFTGVFERQIKDAERVQILLNTISYQAHVVLDANLIEKPALGTAGT